MKVNSNNEWDKLETVILGNVFENFTFGVDLTFRLFFKDYYDWGWRDELPHKRISIKQKYLEELKEDLIGLESTLKKHVKNVLRPDPLSTIISFNTPNWKTEMLPALNVRDQTIVIGNTIVETAPMIRNRYFENDLMQDIFNECFLDGAKWIQMPKARLTEEKINTDMMIDGAQFVRFGKDIIVNVATDSHYLGYLWMKRQFPDHNFHIIKSLVDNHLDSYVVPLCEGVLLLRDKEFLKQMPDFLKDWKIIYPPEISKDMFPKYDKSDIMLTTPFIDMNVLSLDGNKIICNSLFPELSEMFYKEGFDPVEVQHRHRRVFAGGFHCFTLDLERIKHV